METKYINIYVKDGHVVQRPEYRRERAPKKVIDLTLLFWQAIAVLAIVLLIVSVHIGCQTIDLTQELSTELGETKVELAKVQEAYNRLTGTYWTEDRGFSIVDPLGPESIYDDVLTLKAVSFNPGVDKAAAVKTAEETISSVVESVAPEVTPSYPEVFDQVPLDADLIAYIYNSAIEAGIKPEIMFALGWKETDFTIDLISQTNDYGLFQINQCNFGTLAAAFGVNKSDMKDLLLDPYFNTDCSIYMLTSIISGYNPGDYHQVLMTYNMGPGNAAKNYAAGRYSSEYSRKVVSYALENYGLVDASL